MGLIRVSVRTKLHPQRLVTAFLKARDDYSCHTASEGLADLSHCLGIRLTKLANPSTHRQIRPDRHAAVACGERDYQSAGRDIGCIWIKSDASFSGKGTELREAKVLMISLTALITIRRVEEEGDRLGRSPWNRYTYLRVDAHAGPFSEVLKN